MDDPALELEFVQQELADKRAELEQKEYAPLDYRVTDEDEYQKSLLRLRAQVRELEDEERRLLEIIDG